MTTLKICKLHFTAPLHIGDVKANDYGTSLKTLASDTMYAALTASLAKLGTAIPDDGELGFTISSLFPFYQQGHDTPPVCFFPQPMRTHMPQLKDIDNRKKTKKVKWLDASYFERVLAGETLFNDSDEDIKHIHGEYLTRSQIPADFMQSQVVQRVRIPSRTGEEDAEPYYVDNIRFQGFSGLYFIVVGDTALLDKALALLSLEGIGSDRNVGYGLFEYHYDNIVLNLPSTTDYAVSLSLLIPESQDHFNALTGSEHVAYDIERRGGWITTYPFRSLRKNVIYGFTAGSVFHESSIAEPKIAGRIVNLRPNVSFTEEKLHPIWRSGKSILLPIIV